MLSRALAKAADHRVPWLVAVSGAALVLSVAWLGRESMWLDEAFSFSMTRLSWRAFVDVMMGSEGNMGPYYGLLRGWAALLGESESALRSLSVLFAVASAPLAYHVTDRLAGRQTAVLVSALLVVNSFFIQYAQEARGYTMALFLVLATTSLFVRAVTRPSWPIWGAYVAVSGIAVYAHFFAGLVLLAHAASLAFLDPADRPSPRMLAGSALGIATLLAPLGAFLVTTANPRGWIPSPSLEGLARSGAALAGAQSPLAGGALVLIYAGASAAGVVVAWRVWRREGRSQASWRSALMVSWLSIPVAGALLVSLWRPIFVGRYLLVSLPALLMIAATGLTGIRRGRLAGVMVVALLALSAHQVGHLHRSLDKPDWRAASQYVVERSHPGDGIAFHRANGRTPFGYQVRTEGDRALPTPVLPTFDWTMWHPTEVGEPDLEALWRAIRTYDRAWVVLAHGGQDDERVRRMLERGFRREDSARLHSVSVELHVRSPAG